MISPLSSSHTCAHSFVRNWQLPFLNQRKEIISLCNIGLKTKVLLIKRLAQYPCLSRKAFAVLCRAIHCPNQHVTSYWLFDDAAMSSTPKLRYFDVVCVPGCFSKCWEVYLTSAESSYVEKYETVSNFIDNNRPIKIKVNGKMTMVVPPFLKLCANVIFITDYFAVFFHSCTNDLSPYLS